MLKIELKNFTLTNDLVPIHFLPESYGFICPLPRGYIKAIANSPDLCLEIEIIKESINLAAKEKISPFENLLLGCDSKTEAIIECFTFFNNELFSAFVEGNTMGDVYLNTDTHLVCDPDICEIDYLFEIGKAFECHNVDYYWQALLLRELVVRYFNLLNRRLTEIKKD
ncbi:MAG: hypothetical protein WCX30_02990 [Candidatus Paceibacterota bacterium]|jgi:hypothetical protein